MDLWWIELQNKVKENYLIENYLPNRMFINYCIYCYLDFLILLDNEENNYYNKVIEVINKKKC